MAAACVLAAASILVTLVTIGAVVHVPAHALVPRISVRFGVAIGALEHAVIAGICVAGRAHAVGVAMVDVEPGVVEGRARPTGGRVTKGTGIRESRRDVVRVGGSRVIGFVAAVAIGRNRSVVILDMTAGTRHRRMRPSQRESGVVVIERRRAPGRGAMAHVALLWESNGGVVRVIGAGIVG